MYNSIILYKGMKKNHLSFMIVALLLLNTGCKTEAPAEMDISGNKWRIWLDQDAEWANDELFLPPVDISLLPVNPPTIGWDELFRLNEKTVSLPATVEEHFWHLSGNERGISGNYTGVSWFYTTLEIPAVWKGKNIFIDFESVRLRAEVFINRELAGYDLINGTPFSVDITGFIKTGAKNEIAVRVTDPNGNFAWRDWDAFYWGERLIPPSHGFGGITGKVGLRATDDSFISDVFIKPLPDLETVDIECTIGNHSAQNTEGTLFYSIHPYKSAETVVSGEITVPAFTDNITITRRVNIPDAKTWSVENPDLYVLQTEWASASGDRSVKEARFGLRHFEVREDGGDRMFFLNGKRIVLRSAISWGHWPVNGIYPTDELARKQIETAKALGLNMLHFHRGIGQTSVLSYADELGLLYYQEPGGYRPNESELIRGWKREKLLRMVRRDRNHPSLVMINMINESTREPFENEIRDMIDAHKLDETRIITFTSTHFPPRFHDGKCPVGPAAFKSHMLPYDGTIYDSGWWDEHHAGGPGVYDDHFYNGPGEIFRHYDIPEEIILLGEDGAIGTLPRLQLIKEEMEKTAKKGWDGNAYMEQYQAVDDYLKARGYAEAFPDVDALTLSIGANAHYYHGRIIENFRIGNTGDGYVINGWENTKIENHSGIVDIYRNPKADVSILAHYNQPLYVAVKIRDKVIAAGEGSLADFFVVNEAGLSGNYLLQVSVSDEAGNSSEQNIPVKITGGNVYGELLADGFPLKTRREGYLRVNAELLDENREIFARGFDEIYAVALDAGVNPMDIVVADTSGKIQELLQTIPGVTFREYQPAGRRPDGRVMVVGRSVQPGFVQGNFRMDDPVMDWVSEGNVLVIVSGADNWAEYLGHKEVIEYRGKRVIDRNWFGGNYFVREHPLFDGLPVNTAFNWEYQCLARYNRERFGLRLPEGESVVGVYADHKTEVYTAVAIIPLGKGKIILSTLDLEGAIGTGSRSAVVARKILQNYLRYSVEYCRIRIK